MKVCLWCNCLRQRYEFLLGRLWNYGLFHVCWLCLNVFSKLLPLWILTQGLFSMTGFLILVFLSQSLFVNSLNLGFALVILENGLINVVVRMLEVRRGKLDK